MASIRVAGVAKVFPGGQVALRSLDLEVRHGELVVLVGPSGSGKSTLLRLIAGLDQPSAGRIHIGERDVTALAPSERDLAMVFQSYALYPHLRVRDNLGFGLRMRGLERSERARRVEETARALGLAELLDRYPRQLSGGQRQRVALGRAIVREPLAFLFDEPLSNLDAALRADTRAELKRLHRRLGATIVHVTHDQEEAMTLGDRVAVLHRGALEQMAPPLELYRAPATRFVASFVGTPSMNLFRGTLHHVPDGWRVESEPVQLTVSGDSMARAADEPASGTSSARPSGGPAVTARGTPSASPRPIWLGIRPDDIALGEPEAGDASARVDLREPLGSHVIVHLALPGGTTVRVTTAPDHPAREGDVVGLRFRRDRLHLFDQVTERRVDLAEPRR